jgi:hypothetical protein
MKAAMITGACINTGVAMVEKFASEGKNVVFTGRSIEKVKACEAQYRAKFPDVVIEGFALDSLDADGNVDEASVKALFGALDEKGIAYTDAEGKLLYNSGAFTVVGTYLSVDAAKYDTDYTAIHYITYTLPDGTTNTVWSGTTAKENVKDAAEAALDDLSDTQTAEYAYSNGDGTDANLQNGNYLRIKNIELGYTLPYRFLAKAGVSSLRFFVSVQNVYTFTEFTGYDVEAWDTSNTYPGARAFIGGISLNF